MANQSILLSKQEGTTQCTSLPWPQLHPHPILSPSDGSLGNIAMQYRCDFARDEYMDSGKSRCSSALWEAVSQSGVYVWYRWLLSVLSQGGMSSVSSGVTKAQKKRASCWTSTLSVASIPAMCHNGLIGLAVDLAMLADWHEHAMPENDRKIYMEKSGLASIKGNQYNFSAP